MPTLKEQEERLRFLLSRVDAEAEKFQKIISLLDAKENALNEEITDAGLQTVPINIAPHSATESNLYDEVRAHLMELNKMKNFLSGKLNVVIKEEELIGKLNKKYGKNVQLKKLGSGEFEIDFKDAESEKAYAQLNASKKLIAQLKESVSEITPSKEE